MREIAEGLWHWMTPHPGWESSEPWDEEVSSYAMDDGARLLLFDPLGLPGELEERAGDRETLIVLTSPWHERDTRSLVERLEAPVYTPRPDTAQDLIDKYGVTAEQAGDGSPDLRWLLTGEAGEGRYYAAGDQLPFGALAYPGREPNDLVLWFEPRRTVVTGDTLVDFGQGLEIHADWLRPNVSREQVVEGLRPLLERPVDHVLATHGGPTDRAALERALA